MQPAVAMPTPEFTYQAVAAMLLAMMGNLTDAATRALESGDDPLKTAAAITSLASTFARVSRETRLWQQQAARAAAESGTTGPLPVIPPTMPLAAAGPRVAAPTMPPPTVQHAPSPVAKSNGAASVLPLSITRAATPQATSGVTRQMLEGARLIEAVGRITASPTRAISPA